MEKQLADSRISALLVHDRADHLLALERALGGQRVQIFRASTCREAGNFLQSSQPPHVIFTDTKLPDGGWPDVLELAANAAEPVNVIIVARLADVRLYLDAMAHGAFDFITPFSAGLGVDHLLHAASEGVISRRKASNGLRGRPDRNCTSG
jgi:DNA-binding NtrC family response regulator